MLTRAPAIQSALNAVLLGGRMRLCSPTEVLITLYISLSDAMASEPKPPPETSS